ncbi:hypothetical protein BN946_scf184622.g3 [Trametes cinnabarina]|uniref:Uncharacterized protein n=1 Tax=Pycnoporus cinnabarinus TaxID=5643 RepID=A0A060SQ40_PYCCI|nr:hypothetical protein BN946_scf184622.g3 [Trametes cinnabarina]
MRDHTELVESLNDLLDRLGMKLPFALETPFDLTPSLLLGILESILEERLPISPAVRASRDFASKVQAMKIFLGVFETDVLGGMDVGLSDVDPRRLVVPGRDEEGSRLVGWSSFPPWRPAEEGHGISHSGKARPRAPSRPSTHSTITSGVHSNLSMARPALAETDTTVMSIASEPLAPLGHVQLPEMPTFRPQSDVATSSQNLSSSSRRPRCIHEVDGPSFLGARPDDSLFEGDSASICDCGQAVANADEGERDDADLPATPTSPVPVREEGWIEHADEESEINFYHSRRAPSNAPATTSRRANSYAGLSPSPSVLEGEPHVGATSRRIITPHNAPTEYTLALLNERARLYEELAKLKAAALVK